MNRTIQGTKDGKRTKGRKRYGEQCILGRKTPKKSSVLDQKCGASDVLRGPLFVFVVTRLDGFIPSFSIIILVSLILLKYLIDRILRKKEIYTYHDI